MIQSIKTQKAVIFDLGGVLLQEAETNLHKVPHNWIKNAIKNGSSQKIFNRMFEFAALFLGANCKNSWLLGKLSGHDITITIKNNIDNPLYDSFFINENEKYFIKHGTEFILLPDLLAQYTELIHAGFEFVKKCKKSGYTVAIISNWDPLSFDLIKQKIPQLFTLFDEQAIIIPLLAHAIKPSFEIYDFTMKQLNLHPSQCFFIDDSLLNVQAAQAYGLQSIVHTNWENTEHQLVQQGLLLK